MRHVIPLLIKFALWGTVLFSIFTIFNAPLSFILIITLATAVASYVLGDIFVLPRTGNWIASIADLFLSFGLIWFFSYLLIQPTANMAYASFYAALAVAAGEPFFHLFMENRIFDGRMRQTRNWLDDGRWATEFAEEYEDDDHKE
ncbi:YndM family protein [Anoxybacteroides tepidamans]|uniref:YndM family protein n=1 Tax=Anoxybacteroides tepidamans TaxID=265948 RepID=UPI0004803F01|nr:YndM family protein [Anoxybacillus tepidamans]